MKLKEAVTSERMNRELTNKFVLGTQYYRVIPPPEEWEEDLAHIKKIGMNTVKIQADWNQVERTLGKYSLDEITGLMDTAQRNGLKVLIQIPLEAVPDCVFKAHQCQAIDLKRQSVPMRRWAGGVWKDVCCWDNPGLKQSTTNFVLAVVKKYKDYPNLLCWDVCQEVEINECACRYTKLEYQKWLKKKFKDIKLINQILGEHYASFEEIEPPYSADDHGRAYEGQAHLFYMSFRIESLTQRIRWLYNLTKSCDNAHPVIVHAHSGMGLLWRAGDDWMIAKEVDFYGTSTHEMPRSHNDRKLFAEAVANLEIQRSASIDKNYYWISELSAGSACLSPNHHIRINEGELFFNLWTCVAHGAKGIFFWQFKPERHLMQETPAGWGLINLNGEETYRTEEFKCFQQIVKKNEKLFLNMKAPATEYGVLYSPDASGISDLLKFVSYRNAFRGTIYLLWINNIQFDILRFTEELSKYKRIYCPIPWLLDKETVFRILDFVKNGGVFISESGFARYTEDCWLSKEVPGYGLSEKLGFKEADFALVQKIKISTKKGIIYGSQERGWINPGKNPVVGTFENGKPAIIESSYGKGKFVYLGTSMSSYFADNSDITSAKRCVDMFGFKASVQIKPLGQVTARLQEYKNSKIIFLFNHSRKEESITFSLDFNCSHHKVILGNGIKKIKQDTFKMKMKGKEVVIIEFHNDRKEV